MKPNGPSMHTKTKTSQKMLKAYENKIIPFHRFIIHQLEGNNFEMKHSKYRPNAAI